MSDIKECGFGLPGSVEEEELRLEWARRRLRVVAQGDIHNGIPFVEEEGCPPGTGYLLLPFAGQSWEAIEAAAQKIRGDQAGIRMSVGYIDANGYPLKGENLQLSVLLATRGNPDHGQDPTQPPWGMPPDRFMLVNSLEEARAAVVQFIGNNDVGGGQWVGGDVFQGGQRLGRVAYNGRFFEGNEVNGYGRPAVEFAEILKPEEDVLRKRFATGIFANALSMDDVSYTIDPEFSLSRFEGIRSAAEWRAWYVTEVENEPRLGSRTLGPALNPVIVKLIDDDTEVVTAFDERRIGAAFLRGDSCINAVVIETPAPRPAP